MGQPDQTPAAPETSMPPPQADAPDGVSEMFERRSRRRAKRERPQRNERTMPAPRHPRPAGKTAVPDTDTSVESVADREQNAAATADHEAPVDSEPEATGAADHDSVGEATPAPATPEAVTPVHLDGADAAKSPSTVYGDDESVMVPPEAAASAKIASNAALSWAAAVRKQAHRLDNLAGSVSQARAKGVPALVLRAALADAEYRAGQALPSEVWAAARR